MLRSKPTISSADGASCGWEAVLALRFALNVAGNEHGLTCVARLYDHMVVTLRRRFDPTAKGGWSCGRWRTAASATRLSPMLMPCTTSVSCPFAVGTNVLGAASSSSAAAASAVGGPSSASSRFLNLNGAPTRHSQKSAAMRPLRSSSSVPCERQDARLHRAQHRPPRMTPGCTALVIRETGQLGKGRKRNCPNHSRHVVPATVPATCGRPAAQRHTWHAPAEVAVQVAAEQDRGPAAQLQCPLRALRQRHCLFNHCRQRGESGCGAPTGDRTGACSPRTKPPRSLLL